MTRRRTLSLLFLILALSAGAATWWVMGRQTPTSIERLRAPGRGGRPGGEQPVPVTAAAVVRRDVRLTVDALGTVQALNSITVRTQLDGQLNEVVFREGQEVRRGDLLARIDSRTVSAALAQAEAKKSYDEAQLANARVDLNRYTELSRNNGVTRQQVDTQRASVAMFEAQVRQDQATIDQARTQLDYATIRSPINGRVGIRQVDAGNLVRASDSAGIVSVTQMQPIAVTFTLPQGELPRLLAAMAAGPVPVQVLPGPGTLVDAPVARGTVLTVDNQVDSATGTIRAKAVFPNDDRRLWPGAFVSLRMEMETVPNATVIPLVSVQRGPEGPYSFVVTMDGMVEMRRLTLGAVTQAEAVVRDGLAPGEQVVTSGALRLNVGTQVAVTEPQVAPPSTPTTPTRARRQAAR